jgi:hypothetical protein
LASDLRVEVQNVLCPKAPLYDHKALLSVQ